MENDSILISVVVPIYNTGDYLKKCIESILCQTYKNLDIILVDDGSTDDSPQICDFYSEKDGRITVIHKPNGGLVSARKAGVSAAKGDYIVNVDGDDWIEPERINVLVKDGIMHFGADMVYMAGYSRDYADDHIIIEPDISPQTFNTNQKAQLLSMIFDEQEAFKVKLGWCLCAWAIKRELLQEKQPLINEKIVLGEDAICVLFCLVSAQRVSVIKQNGYHYVQRTSSITHAVPNLSCTNMQPMNIWYHQLKNYLEANHVFAEMQKVFVYLVIYELMIADYSLLLRTCKNYLYPFPQIRRGHKLIVYGAGALGYSLMKFLSESQEYQVMLWVDRNTNRETIPGYCISPIENILSAEYDYIVVAVMGADMAKEIKRSLIQKGIAQDKIATMDVSSVTMEAIPEDIQQDFSLPEIATASQKFLQERNDTKR